MQRSNFCDNSDRYIVVKGRISVINNNNRRTKGSVKVRDLSNGQYSVKKNVRFKTLMLKSDLCDYSDAHIVVKGRINATGNNNANRRTYKLIFQVNILFEACIWKINNIFIDNAENLNIFMPMYNLLKYSNNYSMTLGSLWNYYRHEVNNSVNENNDANNFRINNTKTTRSDSLGYKLKPIGSPPKVIID